MSTVITVENLGKKYLLRHQSGQQPYVALRDVLSDGVKTLGRRLLGRGGATTRSAEREEFWALKDVSFEVKQGDRIGIIGRNGAGKSTLLKILSRITEPTTGSVRIKGRVASLLEVGTGFHPELTGRENIYLNGAILGMGRAEIRKKFDEIVDFAEIEKFLDTPVKRYSSGMYVRLAFAVAAHLEPEILVVDEVLAVGDVLFQAKCLGKMEEVSSKEGRTVLFVSHNLGAIKAMCSSCLCMHAGAIAGSSTDFEALFAKYLDLQKQQQLSPSAKINRFKSVSIEGGDVGVLSQRDNVHLSIVVEIGFNKNINCGITIYNSIGIPLLSSCILDSMTHVSLGINEYILKIPMKLFHSGHYRVEGAIWGNSTCFDQNECLCAFDVLRDDSLLEINGEGYKGYMKLPDSWLVSPRTTGGPGEA
ncbi:ABC transporter ATP-binding protein [Geobacter sp. AOG2]|uniref:ABC transporter ATP-binding protein n=1 Tax=Geobacter sp. AOG2 TaxID=1566347 RepID=UPI001CC77C28|nr:ABC transporter ATP-binding protein [Geobacter sp. AOG2]GFE61334.1 ABC transporter ATP-binding protein [Geobacter sp. AOG2]